ncbi:MAG: sigma factor [Oscillibacter sp.]
MRRYYGRGVEPDDLYQLGCLGFIKAIKGFNFAFGTQFSTYAVPKIAGEIRRFLRDDGAIKVSRSMRRAGGDDLRRARKARKIHSGANQRSPSFRRRRDSMPRRSRSVSWRSLRRTACSAKRATA